MELYYDCIYEVYFNRTSKERIMRTLERKNHYLII